MSRRLLVLAVFASLAAVVTVPVAAADPINARGSTQIHAVCGGMSVTVVINGMGEFIPAHVIGSTSIFIPTAFNLIFTFTPTVGAPMPEPGVAAKAAPVSNTTTCTVPLQTLFSGPEGSFTIQGTVTGFFTPR